MRNAGLIVHKFNTNEPALFGLIPEEKTVQTNKKNMNPEVMLAEKALGIYWITETDEFEFRTELKKHAYTRRGVLSVVASIFDPMGFVGPVVLLGKNILHDLCKGNTSWDEPLDQKQLPRWQSFLREFQEFPKLKIPRCLTSKLDEVSNVELHYYSDASTRGYGACVYLRCIDVRGHQMSTLVVAKSRVAPSKPVTIPRLELTAAVTSVQLKPMLEKEMTLPVETHKFFTDSMVVLGYLNNKTKEFQLFVTNRLHFILAHSKSTDWSYVNTKDNPADLCSRGCSVTELLHSNWLTGPLVETDKEVSTGKVDWDGG